MKYLTSVAIFAVCGAALTSCSDWTEPKSIDVKYGTIEEAENYPAYLESLREYRATDHTQIYAWVDLTEDAPKNQSQRVTSLPDSIDVLVMTATTNLDPVVASDLQKVRQEKGMKVLFDIDFDALKAQHTELCALNAVDREKLEAEFAVKDLDDPAVKAEYDQKLAALTDPELKDFLIENITSSLDYVKKTSLDGAIFSFDGKSINYLEGSELAEYTENKNLFLGAASDWFKNNPGMMFDYVGKPQNIDNADLLADFNRLFIRQSMNATSVNNFDFIYTSVANVNGVPAEKLGMMTTFISSDENDVKTGYLTNGSYAIDALTTWLTGHKVAAVGVKNVQVDYFTTPSYSYPHVRALIQAANPKY